MSTLTHAALNARYEQEQASLPDNTRLRLHRALSWLEGAEQCRNDDDARFIFLWIAFNAAYANESWDRVPDLTEREKLRRFIRQLIELDPERLLGEAVWSEFSGPIRVLLDNRFVFKPFWDWKAGQISEDSWKWQFERDKKKINRALAANDTGEVLMLILSRLYVLRNQIIHGGASRSSSVNREQLRDGAAILGRIVPLVVLILMNNPQASWGRPWYPVVQ